MVQLNQNYSKTDTGSIDIPKWLNTIMELKPDFNQELFNKGLSLLNSHVDDKEQQICIEIAGSLLDLKMDSNSILAGFLISVVRSSAIDYEQVALKVSKEVAELLRGVIKMDAIRGVTDKVGLSDSKLKSDVKAEQLRKMFIAMVKDPRVVVIRLVEHLSELKLSSKENSSHREDLARETKLLYAPLANRLGIGQIKWQLEDYAFRYLETNTYKAIAKLLDEKRVDRDKYIKNLINDLKSKLTQENIVAEVQGRVKHIFSIWRKMQRKNIEFDELYDIRAVRILTDTVANCYAALGMVHGLWQHIPKEFDDYIAMPKDNGYQSLHTAVFGPSGKIIEVQIRTHDMHNDSELGVAAHWRYKEGVHHDKSFDTKIAWLRQLISWQDEVSTASELLDELTTDITEDRVYVLTPKGDVFDLPEGATPLDLAYSIHTEVGNKCCGAKVNCKMVNLTYSLATGDQVEILTRSNTHPSRDWLIPSFNFIKTPRARSKVQAWFKKQDFSRNVIDGKVILERESQRLGVGHINLEQLPSKLNVKTEQDILAGLARGDIKFNNILIAANIDLEQRALPEKDEQYITSQHKTGHVKSSKGINISGVDNLLTTIAGCCKPLPGNKIIGYVSQARGITIHCDDCVQVDQIKQKNPDRLIDVSWGQSSSSMRFVTDIYLISRDRQGLLRDVTGLLSAEKINIINLKTDVDKDGLVYTFVTLEVSSVEQLSDLVNKIKLLPNIISVKHRI